MATIVSYSEKREGLYIIGTEEPSYLQLRMQLCILPDNHVGQRVISVTYDYFYANATLFSDYDKAKKTLDQIKERAEEIQFLNNDPIGHILDRENGYVFDVNKLKIFSLIPFKCRENMEVQE